MEHSTFTDPDVLRDAARFSMLQADVTESSGENELLLEDFGVLGVPTIIFYDSVGCEVDRVVGFVDAEEFRRLMLQAEVGSARQGINTCSPLRNRKAAGA
jgi:thiol:disulfide interchange protein DsbD